MGDPLPESEYGLPRQHHRRERHQRGHHPARAVFRGAPPRCRGRSGATLRAQDHLGGHLRGERRGGGELRLVGRGEFPRLQPVRLHGHDRHDALLGGDVSLDASAHRAGRAGPAAARDQGDAARRQDRGTLRGVADSSAGPGDRHLAGGDRRRGLGSLAVLAAADRVRIPEARQPQGIDRRRRVLGHPRRRRPAVVPDAYGGHDRNAGARATRRCRAGRSAREARRDGYDRLGVDAAEPRPGGAAPEDRAAPRHLPHRCTSARGPGTDRPAHPARDARRSAAHAGAAARADAPRARHPGRRTAQAQDSFPRKGRQIGAAGARLSDAGDGLPPREGADRPRQGGAIDCASRRPRRAHRRSDRADQ